MLHSSFLLNLSDAFYLSRSSRMMVWSLDAIAFWANILKLKPCSVVLLTAWHATCVGGTLYRSFCRHLFNMHIDRIFCSILESNMMGPLKLAVMGDSTLNWQRQIKSFYPQIHVVLFPIKMWDLTTAFHWQQSKNWLLAEVYKACQLFIGKSYIQYQQRYGNSVKTGFR